MVLQTVLDLHLRVQPVCVWDVAGQIVRSMSCRCSNSSSYR